MPKLDVLVVGATGRQGGAVARSLLQGGHRVRALTRNMASRAADTLRLRGARLAWADLRDDRGLEDAARGVDAVFLVTTPRDGGPALEAEQGLRLAETVRRLDIPHLVFSSVAPATARSGVPAFDSKHEIEAFLHAARVPHTVVCPAFFMENLLGRVWIDGLRRSQLPLPLPPRTKLQQVALADFGRFVRLVLERRDEFIGSRVPIASDELSPIEAAATLARVIGLPIQHQPDAGDRLRGEQPDAAALIDWTRDNTGPADVPGLRRRYDEVNWHTLDGWALRQDWKIIAPGEEVPAR